MQKDVFIIDAIGSQGADFRKGCILEHQIFGFAMKFCVTGAALRVSWPHFSVDGVEKNKSNCYEAVSSAIIFPFLKDVLQNCFVFGVLNFENCGSLVDLINSS